VGTIQCRKKSTAPCQEACPAGIDVPRYIRHTRDGRFEKTLVVIRERIPFPFVCGCACVHPCEAKCARIQIDEAVAIRMLKRVAAEKGAWKPARMGIPGEDSPKVIDGISFLRQVNEGKTPAIGRKVIVVGGGNTAVDAARASIRLGAEVVQVYRRTRSEMSASGEEIVAAVEEGVRIEYLTAPVKIGEDQAICIRMKLGDADATGRPTPVPVAGSEYTLSFNTLIMAIGQSADAAFVNLGGLRNGTVHVDKGNLATLKKGVFTGGDAVTGPSTIIEAIAQGRPACASIDRFLGGTGVIPEALSKDENPVMPETAPRGTTRRDVRKIALKRRRATFDPIELAYERKAAAAEASGCLSCDLRESEVAVNDLICKDCGYYREVCSLDIFKQSEDFNPSGYKPAIAVNTDKCVGCLRCLYICPDFAITIRERISAES